MRFPVDNYRIANRTRSSMLSDLLVLRRPVSVIQGCSYPSVARQRRL